MAERNRFQSQALDSTDYAMTEKGAKAVKNGGLILSVAVPAGLMVKKYGRRVIKSLGKIRKI